MDDLDLVQPFLWWEAAREPLRCTVFRNPQAIQGVLDNGEIYLANWTPGGDQTERISMEPFAEALGNYDRNSDQKIPPGGCRAQSTTGTACLRTGGTPDLAGYVRRKIHPPDRCGHAKDQ